jgi:3-oxoacyl-[acyl-carrier protein] reductase
MKAIVVGATQGIGEAIYGALPPDAIGMSRSSWYGLDLLWPERLIEQAVERALKDLGEELDALVISAGMGAYMSARPMPARGGMTVRVMDDGALQEIFRTNVIGRIHVYRACLKALIRAGGHVLFLGSTVATGGAKGLSAYGATMAAMNGFVVSEAKAIRRKVRMNVLAPAWVRTPMTDGMREDYRAAAAASMPQGRFLEPGEVADRALQILDSDVTGQVIEMWEAP